MRSSSGRQRERAATGGKKGRGESFERGWPGAVAAQMNHLPPSTAPPWLGGDLTANSTAARLDKRRRSGSCTGECWTRLYSSCRRIHIGHSSSRSNTFLYRNEPRDITNRQATFSYILRAREKSRNHTANTSQHHASNSQWGNGSAADETQTRGCSGSERAATLQHGCRRVCIRA